MNDDEFTCAVCDGTFLKEWTDEEMKAEKVANGWGDLPDDECAVVCDECYQAAMVVISGLTP